MKVKKCRNVQGEQHAAGGEGICSPGRMNQVLLAIGVVLSGHASAQDAPAEDGKQLPFVVVTGDKETATGPVDGYTARRSATGTKTDTPLIETPQSVSVITRQELEDQAADTVGAALRYTPGVNAEAYGGADTRTDYYAVRGFPDQFPYVDGLSTSTFFTVLAPTFDTYGLERVEVLHGPSSVLYGANIPGGIVNLVTKKPTNDPLHEVSLDAGSYGLVGARFDLSDALSGNGSLRYRLTGLADDAGTQTDYVREKRSYLAPALTWKSPDTSITFLSHFAYRDGGNPSVDLPAAGTLYANPAGKIGSNFFDGEPGFNLFRRKEEALGYEFEHRFSDSLTIRQNLRYLHAGLDMKIVGDAGLEDDLVTMDRYAFAAQAGVSTFTLDTQAEYKFDWGASRHTLLLGVDYQHSDDNWAEQDPGDVPSLNIFAPVYGTPFAVTPVDYDVQHRLRQVGVYAQDQIHLGQWVATLGVRHDQSTTDTTDLLANQTQSIDADKSTYRLGAVYLFNNGFAPYASYSTSFQPGLGAAFDNVPLKPVTGQSAEAGVKFQPKGQSSMAMLSVYDMTQQNVIEPDLQHPQGEFSVQTGEIRVRGLELSGVADLGDGWKLTAAYTYMDGEVTKSDVGLVGKEAPEVPHNSASVWLDKTFLQGSLHGLGFGGGVRYLGARYGDQENQFEMPAVTLLDASAHYDLSHWRFSLNAQNLADRAYVNCQGSTYCSYGLRRTVLARATYQW